MTRKRNSYLIALWALSIALTHPSILLAAPPELMPTLPWEYQETKFTEVSKAFEERWSKFSKEKTFAPWKSSRSDSEILEEYERMDHDRRKAWYVDPDADTLVSRPEYILAQDLLAAGLYRNLNTLTFDYSKTDSSFNSSTIILDGFRFLALEGPKPPHVSNFLTLLLNHHVTQLIRLTPAYEGKAQMSAPYWQGKTIHSEKEQTDFIKIPQSTQGTGVPYQIPYFVMEDWLDYGAGDPKALLDLVLKVRNSYSLTSQTGKRGLIACHCSSGVSRTGTFIAAFLLTNEIDETLKRGQTLDISVERTVAKLSLLRPHAVGKPKQYLTLYKLVGLYLKNISTTATLN